MLEKPFDHIAVEASGEALNAGDSHYTSYVGPPQQFDFMGASQFSLACAMGLRARHKLLDFGCGSLRAGRLFIPYLNAGNYHGIEPNSWLVRDGISAHLGADIVRIKKPRFSYNEDFDATVMGARFDYIIAQSIFSHTDQTQIGTSMRGFERCLAENGLVLATFLHVETEEEEYSGEGWVYPACVYFRRSTVAGFAEQVGFLARELPWHHPRQSWWVFARHERLLPPVEQLGLLRGAIFNDPEFEASRS